MAYAPLTDETEYFSLGVRWGFSAFALCLGGSYFQRLLRRVPSLAAAVHAAPAFAALWAPPTAPASGLLPAAGGGIGGAAGGGGESVPADGLRSILFTCAYIATKASAPSGPCLLCHLQPVFRARSAGAWRADWENASDRDAQH
jgi:hypothetical protein